jgi:cytochrome b pre-mRNA-processing protein 3
MILRLLRRNPRSGTIRALYGAIVAQARLPRFYTDYGVADTINGRFDLIVLHAVLFLRRLRREPEVIRALGQGVFDLFCTDMDHSLREIGVSDLGVPRKMQQIGEAFYGRAVAYDQALDAGDAAALAAAVARNVLPESPDSAAAQRLAAYVVAACEALDRQSGTAIAQGELTFPPPSAGEPG